MVEIMVIFAFDFTFICLLCVFYHLMVSFVGDLETLVSETSVSLMEFIS